MVEVVGYLGLLCLFLLVQGFDAFQTPLKLTSGSFQNGRRSMRRYFNLEPEQINTLQKGLIEEYKTFFDPMIESMYDKNVEFKDPLNNFRGVDRYRGNVDLLAGRKGLGPFLFSDASIIMHSLNLLPEAKLQARWTLQLTAKFLPWKPRLRFTGISIYQVNFDGKITSQEDFWDSVNLVNGRYQQMGFLEGVKDFVDQLVPKAVADLSAPEFPVSIPSFVPNFSLYIFSQFELLRRAKAYQIRRYPRHLAVATLYTGGRNEGFERLAGYVNGLNAAQEKVGYFAPSLITVPLDNSNNKTMIWPLKYFLPGEDVVNAFPQPANDEVKIIEIPRKTYAVIRFEDSATEQVVRAYTKQLLEILDQDGFKYMGLETLTLAQFNAIYSLNLRRNEIWIELNNHFWG